MKKVLLIGTESPEIEHLAERLRTEGTQVRVAPGGLYALTMLERERPHLILTIADLGDMTGIELNSMVKRDFAVSEVQVVLLARNLQEKVLAERQGDFDLILLDDRPLGALADRLNRLVRHGLLPNPEAPAELPSTGVARELSGTLGVLTFAELTQALSQTAKTGRLHLEADDQRGSILILDGMIQHAVFRNAVGLAAFARLFFESERIPNIPFRFEPLTAQEVLRNPKTLEQTAQQLLLSAAVDLEENTTTEMVTAGIKEWLRREENG